MVSTLPKRQKFSRGRYMLDPEETGNGKYPRTFHLPWSPGGTRDDKRMSSVQDLLSIPLVITEKIDGSNVCLTSSSLYARSHNGPPTHISFDWLKARYAGEYKWLIPRGVSVFCEYAYAVHSIEYDQIPSYLFVIGVRDDTKGVWLPWRGVQYMANKLGVPTVPVVARTSVEDEDELQSVTDKLGNAAGTYGQREGVVVRVEDEFPGTEFQSCVGKWVRKGHVQTDEHWMDQPVRKQKLSG